MRFIYPHRKYWKKYGKRKVRRKFKNIKKDFVSSYFRKTRFYDYLD
ncbi:MAG: hypothetical protein SOV85_01900 [Clostridium sp.]|nr:hypothetical protein [Clostridium sp.]MDY2630097.1 hypothetical protein [Clostridium sp.]